MKTHRFPWFLVVLLAVASVCSAQGGSAPAISRNTVIGTWRLVSVETLRPGGEVSHEWMGRNPVGLIIYDATGHVSVQIMRDPGPTFGGVRDRPDTPDEVKAAYNGYYAYFGTYEVNEPEGTILHRVRGSLWPREVGREYRRHVTLTGDRLTLTTPPFQAAGEQRRNQLIWECVKVTSP